MLLILGDNEGKGLALCRSLAKHDIYAAYSDYSSFIETIKNPPKPKSSAHRRIRDDSMDYYLELYRLEMEEKEPPSVREAILRIPGAVLFLPTAGEHKPMTVMTFLERMGSTSITLALCEEPSDFSEYMKNVDRTVFAKESEEEKIATEFVRELNNRGMNFDVIRYGKLRFYQDEHQAYLYGRRLYLTPSEYKILRFLAFHQGEAFDVENIMRYCFPSTFLRKTSNAVTHICRINQKAREVSKIKLVLFRHGKGYFVIAS